MTHTVLKVKRGQPQAPISSHRLFPVMVALWFAALFGIGSIILPAPLFDTLAIPTATGLSGANAELVITLAATIAGAALGLALARKVAAGQQAEPTPRREFSTPVQPTQPDRMSEPRKPISVDDLAECLDSEDGDNAPRRRALAMEEPADPSDWFHPDLPFSGTAGGASSASSAIEAFAQYGSEPLDLGDFTTQDAHEPIAPRRDPEPALAQMPAVSAWPDENVTHQTGDLADIAGETAAIPLEERELSQLGLSDLTQRLKRAIRIRAEQEAERAWFRAPFIAEPGTAHEVEYQPANAMPSPERSMPKAMRPVSLYDIEDFPEEDFTAPRLSLERNAKLETRQVFGSPIAFSEPDGEMEDADEELADGTYGSLADLGNSFRVGTEFVRIEEPESDDDSAAPAETERALRLALANLQRMSGAA